ncbi:hypothetical protein [Pseudodesulfovibrio sediminis]|uniref:Uncharacterized protein n=1 Tax=Pseudodesulfovibrio sediminis TaxID=2810563 RepID=A0ABN6EU51_9BACT|nr:hypothetical protein [Pseudodesulfovibrio sediminis]BCS88724.1 hypothetical protein PSDVSF_19660 [Pseudodesulfovibrio sediminis]
MKTLHALILTIILTALISPAMASDYVETPPPTGFRGFTWGMELSDAKGLSPVAEAGFKNTYFRQDEKLTLGEAKIKSVAYYFKKGKLYRVGVAFEGRVNQFFLKDMLMRTYGPGRGVGIRYGWMWSDFSIDLNYNEEMKTGGLFYTYEAPLE